MIYLFWFMVSKAHSSAVTDGENILVRGDLTAGISVY